MAREQPDVPEGLIRLLQNFTIAVLQNQPPSIPRFAIEYFTRLLEEEMAQNDHKNPQSSSLLRKIESVETDINSENMDDDYAERMIDIAAQRSSSKRDSIAAEPYNPEDDEEEDDENGERKVSYYEKTPEQRARLMNACRKIVFFSELDDKELTDIVNAMFMKTVQPKEDIIEQHDHGDNFYVIDSGQFEAKIDDGENGMKVVKEYNNEGYFGELALMYNSPRSATVTAKTEGILWALSRQSFRRHVLGHAAKRRRAFMELLRSVRILQDLTPHQRVQLADNLKRQTIRKGESIIHEGDPGDALFFIMEGIVCVKKMQDGIEKELNTIGKGGYFGELALLSNKPRAASVYAVTDVTLAMLGVESFERLLGPCISLMKDKALAYEGVEGLI